MKHTEFEWYGADGMPIFAQTWQPDNNLDLKAVICLVHGMGEHSGRYEHLAKFFANKNYAVIAFDHRGHGKSDGKRGHVASYQILLDQVDRALEETSKRFPGAAKFIYGHSMGGNVVINHALTRNPRVLGVIASAPWLRLPEPVPPKKIWQARLMKMLWGSYTESNRLDTSLLSRDPKVIEAYEIDELVHDKISVRFFLGCHQAAVNSLYNAGSLYVHMLVMHGSEDGITDPSGSQDFCAKAGEGMADLKIWEGLYHELHNEPEQQEVFEYVLDWMEHRFDRYKSLTL